MGTIPDLGDLDDADISDDISFPAYDPNAVGQNGKEMTRGQILNGVARLNASVSFVALTLTGALQGTSITATSVTIGTSLSFTNGATMQMLLRRQEDVTFSNIAAGANEVVTMTVTGAAVGDHVNLSFNQATDAGLVTQAWVSAPNTVSIRFTNFTASTVTGATYGARVMVVRFA